jgi:hypothetical protein
VPSQILCQGRAASKFKGRPAYSMDKLLTARSKEPAAGLNFADFKR